MAKRPLALLVLTLGPALASAQTTSPPGGALDFATFRDRVQPILLDKRPGLARCYVCHSQGAPFRLERLADGRAAWIAGRNLTAIDTTSDEPVWSLHCGVRPIAFEPNADGSTRQMFVQISNFHGFYIVDFEQRREVGRVTLPELPKDHQNWDTLQGSPAHGIGVAPDGKTLWVCSKVNHGVYAYALPGLGLVGGVEVGHHPDWLTFTLDSRHVYIASAGSNSVSVVDLDSMKEVARVPVGQVPKRNVTAIVP